MENSFSMCETVNRLPNFAFTAKKKATPFEKKLFNKILREYGLRNQIIMNVLF